MPSTGLQGASLHCTVLSMTPLPVLPRAQEDEGRRFLQYKVSLLLRGGPRGQPFFVIHKDSFIVSRVVPSLIYCYTLSCCDDPPARKPPTDLQKYSLFIFGSGVIKKFMQKKYRSITTRPGIARDNSRNRVVILPSGRVSTGRVCYPV